MSATELARCTGRGERSAVGTYGFVHGGLIVDGGKEDGQLLGSLRTQVVIPSDWRVVLIRSSAEAGLSGRREVSAFRSLPTAIPQMTSQLQQIVVSQMLPALTRHDCTCFGEAVYQFGKTSGTMFSKIQGGPFASTAIERLVDEIREFGVAGAGQSSWGPTVFAITQSEAEAWQLANWLRAKDGMASASIRVATPNNQGASIASSPGYQ